MGLRLSPVQFKNYNRAHDIKNYACLLIGAISSGNTKRIMECLESIIKEAQNICATTLLEAPKEEE